MNNLTVRKYARNLLASTIGLGIAHSAVAQLEEVLVTATKRSESLQEVPMSISAIGGDSLERMGTADFTDIATSIPSLSLRTSGPGRTKLNIRGISASAGVASTVSFYIDEMPVSSISSGSSTSFAQAIIDPKMFDLERVEVLRGPQGTLYGSSSMGGTVRLITNKPVIGEYEGKVAAEVSQTEEGGFNYSTKGMINAPLGEKAALRIVASYTDNDGYFDRVNSNTGETFAKDVNTEETTSIRAALRFDIGDNAYIQPSIFTQKTEMDGKPNFDYPLTDYDQLSPFNAPEPFEDEFTMANLTYGHDFEMFSLLASYSVMDREFTNVEDISDGFGIIGVNPPPIAGFSDEEVELDDETLEIRLSSNSDSALSWIAGLYQKKAESDSGYRMDRGWNDQTEFVMTNGLANTQKFQKYEETAVFGEVTYSFSDKLDVTVGLRSLDYDYTFVEENWGLAFNGDLPRDMANVRADKISDDEINAKLTVTYHLNDNSQVYGTISDGTRPGGVNRIIPTSDNPDDIIPYACQQELDALGTNNDEIGSYEGDKVENAEFGWKTKLNENVRLNGSVYRVKWTDIQQVTRVGSTCANNFTSNAGEAENNGIELELDAVLSERLTLKAGIGYNDAEFKQDVPNADIESGDQLADVPELSYTISLDYVIPMKQGEVFLFGSYNYVDETLEIPGKASDDVSAQSIDSGNERDDYGILDLRAGYTSENGWEAVIFIDNATDEEAIYGYNDAIAFAFDGSDPTVRNRPRTIGASIRYEF